MNTQNNNHFLNMLQALSVCLISPCAKPAEMEQMHQPPFACRVERRAAPHSAGWMQGQQLLGAGEGSAATHQFGPKRLTIKTIMEMEIRFLDFFFFFQASISHREIPNQGLSISVIQLQSWEQTKFSSAFQPRLCPLYDPSLHPGPCCLTSPHIFLPALLQL